jgi:hypothetical protein
MKTVKPKKPRTVTPKSGVESKPSKPVKKAKLSKKDPNYYSKIGKISARKRKLGSDYFSDMARASHVNRTSSNGGRKKKDADGTKVAL